MREASNNREIVDLINRESGIDLSIISGKREAEIIYYNHVERLAENENNLCHMYVDVGGGSTEILVFDDNKIMESRSFDIGSIRIHEGLVTRREWEDMKLWVKHVSSRYHPISAVGSGGNINFLFSVSKTKEGTPLEYGKLKKLHTYIRSFPIEQRISELGIRPDRADVIVPAAKIYLSVMKWSEISEMFVPQMGLADGIIHVLYSKHKQTFV
jgi:exopolyphosphatase/guanosine-5'-triphosphate,3'-diphosphate pyrophosphatase